MHRFKLLCITLIFPVILLFFHFTFQGCNSSTVSIGPGIKTMNPNQFKAILPLLSVLQIIWGGFVCFYGYRLFKVVLGLIGFSFGFTITTVIVGAISNDAGAALAIGFLGGIVGAGVTLAVYFLGVFLLGASIGLTVGMVFVVAAKSNEMFILAIILGIASGLFALFLQKLMIVVSTAFSGAFSVVTGFALFSYGGLNLGLESIEQLSRFNGGELSAVVLIWLAVGAAGMAVQYRLLSNALASGQSMGKVGWDPRKSKSISNTQLKSVIEVVKDQQQQTSVDEVQETAPQRQSAVQTDRPRCSNCGQTLSQGSKFCDNCGQPIRTTCHNCGKELEADSIFCPGCGAAVSEGIASGDSIDTSSTPHTAFPEIDEDKKPTTFKKQAPSQRIIQAIECPNCGHGNQKGARFCESCGKGLFEECPQCGTELKAQTPFCSFCGTNIEAYNKSMEYVARGRDSMQARQYANAIEEFNIALQQRPDSQELKDLLKEAKEKYEYLNSTVSEAKSSFEEGSYEEAEKLLKEIRELLDDPSEVDKMLASIPEKIEERDFEKFQKQWNEAIESDNPDKALSLAKSNVNRFGHQSIDEYITKAEERVTKQQIERNLKSAEEAFADGDYDFALTSLSSVLSKQPKNAKALELKSETEKAIAEKRKRIKRKVTVIVRIVIGVAIIVFAVMAINNMLANKRETERYKQSLETSKPAFYLMKYPDGKYNQEVRKLLDSLVERSFLQIQMTDNMDSLQWFIRKYSMSKYTPLVQDRITEANRLTKELKLWQAAISLNSEAGYQEYLDYCPTGNHRIEAYRKITNLKEARIWREVRSSNTSAAYKKYLDNYPSGRHANEAYEKYKDLLSTGR